MNIKKVVVGALFTNCYILENNNEVLIIDPGYDEEKIIKEIGNDKKVIGIIITHHHFDHIGALDYLLKYYKVKEYNMSNLSEGINNIGSFKFNTIYTPGHYEDSITLYFEDIKTMFVGDFIFKDSIGRTDLEGANNLDMINSLKNILKYENVRILPGHGDETTLDDERENLKYFIKSLEYSL